MKRNTTSGAQEMLTSGEKYTSVSCCWAGKQNCTGTHTSEACFTYIVERKWKHGILSNRHKN